METALEQLAIIKKELRGVLGKVSCESCVQTIRKITGGEFSKKAHARVSSLERLEVEVGLALAEFEANNTSSEFRSRLCDLKETMNECSKAKI